MKSAGDTRPLDGWRHLTSASTATIDFEFKVDQGLVVDLEFVLQDGLPKVVLKRLSGLQLLIHFCFEYAIGRTASLLCAIERDVRIFQKTLRVIGRHVCDCDPDADADMQFLIIDLERSPDHFDQFATQLLRFKRLVDADLNDRELVAAKARHRITAFDAALEAIGQLLQENVAGPVPKRVVHFLEVIEVQADYRNARRIPPLA